MSRCCVNLLCPAIFRKYQIPFFLNKKCFLFQIVITSPISLKIKVATKPFHFLMLL